MKLFLFLFFVCSCFIGNGQMISLHKNFLSKNASSSIIKRSKPISFKNARASFAKKALNPNACYTVNYGCSFTGTLSVSDLKFGGERKSETNVQLNWTTTDEINNYGFEIQRKIGIADDFIKIGFVKAIEQKSTENKYGFLDVNDANETSYYRLKIIENSGNYTFSKIIAVNSFDQSLALKIASNPINGDEIHLEIFGLKSTESVNFTIFDALGRKILDTNQSVSKTNSKIKLSKNSDFKIGRYFVRASFKDKILMNNFVIAQ